MSVIVDTLRWTSALSARSRYLIVAAACFGLLAAGLTIGVLLNLHPCPFCIFQRVLYLVIGFSALAGAVFAGSAGGRYLTSGLGLGAALGGLATALYQTYMQLFPGSVVECGFSEPNLIERFVDLLGTYWEFMFLATGLCSSVDWTFLGLSMANWSILAFPAFGAMLVWAARGRSR
jgi:protein dithiol:quinone oxidoreductase